MNLAQMRTKMNALTGGLTRALSDADLDTLLQAAYQYTIPSDVPGELSEGEWTFAVFGGTGEVEYPDTVHSVLKTAPLLENGDKLSYHTRPGPFWREFDQSGGVNATPTAALFYGRTMHLRPIPDTTYIGTVFVREFPVALNSGVDVANTNHAMAIVTAAALEYAEDMDADSLAEKLTRKYNRYINRLKTQTFARSHERVQMRSF